MSLVPMVIEQTGRGERSFDIYSRLLNDRIVMLCEEVNDTTASLVCLLYTSTLYECCETGKHLRENDLHVNFAAAQRYTHYVQFFALFCGARAPSEAQARSRDCLLDTPADDRLARMLQTAQREFVDNVDWLTFCRSATDLQAAADAGKAAAFLSIEGAELLPDRPDALERCV